MCFGILFYIKLDIGYSDNSVRNILQLYIRTPTPTVINVQRFIPIPSAPRITQGEAHALSLDGNEDAASASGTATGPGLVLCPNIPQVLGDLWMHLGILGPLGAINEG